MVEYKLLDKIKATPNFTIDKIKGKYLILECLVFVELVNCLRRLWSMSFKSRSYIIKNYRYLLDNLYRLKDDIFLNFTDNNRVLSNYLYLTSPFLSPCKRITMRITLEKLSSLVQLLKNDKK